MFKVLVAILVLLCMSTHGHAGLDNEGKFGFTVAIYKMENRLDSGPRDFDFKLHDGASFVNQGKEGKCLQVNKEDGFVDVFDEGLFIGGEFSIVAWVKLRKQAGFISLSMNGLDSTDDLYFADLVIQPNGNLKGYFVGDDANEESTITANNVNVSDGRWHHIAFTSYGYTHRLFVDGEIEKQKRVGYMGFGGDFTALGVIGETDKRVSNVLIDDLAFFEIGLGSYAIKGLMRDGIDTFLETMPVDPQSKVATTWGDLKTRKY